MTQYLWIILTQNKYLESVSYYDLTIPLERSYVYIEIVKCSVRSKEHIADRKAEDTELILGLCSLLPPASRSQLVWWYCHCPIYLFFPPLDYELPQVEKTYFILSSLEPNTVPGNTCSLNIYLNQHTSQCGHGKFHERDETGWKWLPPRSQLKSEGIIPFA